MEETQSTEIKQKSGGMVWVLVAIVVLIIAGGGYFYLKSVSKQVSEQSTAQPTGVPTVAQSAEKTFTVKGTNFAFNPKTITVSKGDKVKIVFQDDNGFHNLIVEGYDVKTQTIQEGNSAEITFTADKAGTFAYYCGVGNHREKGMQGTLIVQ